VIGDILCIRRIDFAWPAASGIRMLFRIDMEGIYGMASTGAILAIDRI